ncbi:hypothetical protein L0337_19295 [candidate division KSB1 bacterium]|nr:hypothetical protein [candidate division KSB1 bacterium]
MHKKGNLFSLIKSLSMAEKRFFKVYAASNKTGKNYLLLFDFIDKQERYDEPAIKAHFADRRFVKQLHVTKIYLSNLILKALRSFHAKPAKSLELKNLLLEIEILFRKGLFDQCHYTIDKAIAIAGQYEKYPDLLELYGWKRRLLLEIFGAAEGKAKVNEILQQEKTVVRKLATLNDYRYLGINIFDILNGAQDESGKLESMKTNPTLDHSTDAAGVQGVILYHHVLYAYYISQRDIPQAEKHISAAEKIIEAHPELIQEDPASYITALNNKIGLCFFLKRQDTIAALLSKITAIPQKYGLKYLSPVTVKLLLRTYNMELELYRDTGRYAQGVALAEKIKDFLETHHRFAPAEYQLSIYYQFAYLYFMQQDFRQALFWLNEIFRRNFGAVREDLQSYAQLLHLIIHFDLGNTAVLKYAVDSCRRFLKKKRSLQSFERVLLRYFSRLSTTLPEKHRALLEKMQAELFAETAEKDKANVLDFLDFEAWLQRKLNE